MKLSQILSTTAYTVVQGSTDTDITDLVYDSRKAAPGCAFVCLVGYNTDGHEYAEGAIKNGASAIIVSKDINAPENVTVIKTDDTRRALAFMSAELFENPSRKLITIGLTGTKGKTTTTAMIRSVLEKGGIKTGTIGTLGIVIGDSVYKTNNTTPESYEIQKAMRQMIDEGCKAMVIEASSLGLKWHRTDAIHFDYGVFTNFSHDHIGDSEHKDMDEYLYCKSLLFKQCSHSVANIDDEMWQKATALASGAVETFGFDSKADICAYDERLVSRPDYLGVGFKTKNAVTLDVSVPIPGKFSVYNALAAIAVCRHIVDEKAIAEGLDCALVKGRVEPVPVKGDYTLLIDYAHNAVSMENVLTTLREYKPNRLITMFGAGGNRPRDRRFEMGEISGRLSDLSVITEDNSRFEDVMDIIADIKTGIERTQGKYVIVPDRRDAIRYCMTNAQSGDIVVLAGKGHEDYQEIKGVKYHMDEREIIAELKKELESE